MLRDRKECRSGPNSNSPDRFQSVHNAGKATKHETRLGELDKAGNVVSNWEVVCYLYVTVLDKKVFITVIGKVK